MARSARDSKLEVRAQRVRLTEEHRPYWVVIGQGLYLGYRKGIKGGAWIVRYYEDGKYITQKLGKADDFQEANDVDILNYFQAQTKAREFAENKEKGKIAEVNSNKFKVFDACENYLKWFKAHRKSYSVTQNVIQTHILPTLGNKLVNNLSAKMLREWHESLATMPPRIRSTIVQVDFKDPEVIRQRKASANRILTNLKAALNHAWRDGLVESDEAWRKVKPFHNVDMPKIRYLEMIECQRLINACDPDFRQLVRAALLTGCRYGELIKLKIADVNLEQKTVFIRETKNGKPRCIPLNNEGAIFFEEMTAGKLGGNFVFTHADGEAWGTSHQARRLKEACQKVGIDPAVSFHILRHTYGSLLASRGVSLQVISELLGHSDTRITSKHYAHLMPSFVADTLRANLPEFIHEESQKVVKLKNIKIN